MSPEEQSYTEELRTARIFITIQTAVIALGLVANAVVFGFLGRAFFVELETTPADVHALLSESRETLVRSTDRIEEKLDKHIESVSGRDR